MGDKIARERLKQKVLERWENEGGKTETEPKPAPPNNPTKGHESGAKRSARSSKSRVDISVARKIKRKSS
jgi:hypothetical protein